MTTKYDYLALASLIDAMTACRRGDLDALDTCLTEAEQHLNGRHAARGETVGAREAARAGDWQRAYVRVRVAVNLLITIFPSDPAVLPSAPSILDCVCGWEPRGTPNFCILCGAPMRTRPSTTIAVSHPGDPDLTTHMSLTISTATLTRGVICILFCDGSGVLDRRDVQDEVGQIIIDLGAAPAALQAVDQAHARLRTWAEKNAQVRMIKAPGRLARLIGPDDETVTIPEFD